MTIHAADSDPHVTDRLGANATAAPEADSGTPAPDAPAPLTEAEAISSLNSEVAPGREELAQAMTVVGRILDRFGTVPSLRIGSISVFNDDVLVENGDFTVGGDRAERRRPRAAAPLAPEVLRRHIGAYIQPPGYPRALRILRREHLVVLAAPVGTGREACALALLAELAEKDRLRLVGEDLAVSEAAWRAGTPGGYLASDVDPEDIGRLGETWLRSTAAVLRATGGYLVVVTTAAAALPGHPAAGLEYVVDDLGVPDPMAVLRERARTTLRTGRSRDLDRVLDSPEIADLMAEQPFPRFAARAAVALADAVNRGAHLAEVVAGLCDPAERVRAWFERMDAAGAEGDQEIVLAIGAAVLDGCGYLAVTDAATGLYRRLHAADPKLRFRRSLRSTQSWLQVHVPDEPATGHGDPRPEALRFRNPRVQTVVVAYVWMELDGLRPALIAWLRELAGNADVDVRACVAASAGLLATVDFTYAVHHLLLPWAGSPSPAVRTCAGLALAVPSRDPRYADRVLALLREWAGVQASRRGTMLARTAAEAIGGIAGHTAPNHAVSILHQVLEGHGWDCLPAIALGILSLIENGHTGYVLDALLDWSEEQDESSQVVKTLAVFVAAARAPAAAVPVAPPSEATTRWSATSRKTSTATPVTAGAIDTAARRGSRSRVVATGADGTKRIISADHTPGPPTPAPVPPPDRVELARPSTPALSVRRSTPRREPWPVLLQEAEGNRQAVRDLWARALACKPVRTEALSALRSWLDLAERDPAAVPAVSGVCRALGTLGGKHGDRIRYHLEQWATHPRHPSRMAEQLLAPTGPDHR